MRLAIIHKEKCKPGMCGHNCSKCCPVNKKALSSKQEEGLSLCVTIKSDENEGKAKIDEKLCVGCSICQQRCPLEAIQIINLPSVKEEDLIFRYGVNGFALYGLPIPKIGSVLGLLGRNGIGKSSAVEILSGKKEIDYNKFKGTELQKYFDDLKNMKINYKPQNLFSLSIDVSAIEVLEKRGGKSEIIKLAEMLGVDKILNNKLNKLSGGELQRIAILAASLGDADIYFFDEPLAYLDISERLRVSDFIKKIAKDKTVIVVEHDLLILDYLTDYLNIFYGEQGGFGLVSGVKASKHGVNSYLSGFLKEENLRIRDKELNFNFTKNKTVSGNKIGQWSDFEVKFSKEKDSAVYNSINKKLSNKEEQVTKLGGEKEENNENGFNLKVKSGEIRQNHVIGILGRNGTGKTSFVKALAGEIPIKGLDLDLQISYKPQYLFSQSEELVRDIIFKEKINKKLSSMFNIGVLQQKKLNQLSGGELQRFSIARCLAKDADIYLIDEPSAYLDVEERISAAKAIKEIMSEKEKTAFVVEHDLLLISYLADSVIVFSGKPGECGESSEIMGFEEGISMLLKELDITFRKDKESGRPRINSKGSVLDREQRGEGRWAVF